MVFTEAFPAPPVLIHAHYSRLNFDMLGVAMLKDVPWHFVWQVFKNFCQKFGQLCVKITRVAHRWKIFPSAGDFSPAHISCHLRLQSRSSCKMIILAAQNS